jgi:hypothetical protein
MTLVNATNSDRSAGELFTNSAGGPVRRTLF